MLAIVVELSQAVGLIQGESLSTAGQLEPFWSCHKGCTYTCEDGYQFPLDEVGRQELGGLLQSGAKRGYDPHGTPDAP